MTQLTYKKIIKKDKGYLVLFLKQMEDLPRMKYLGGEDLSEEEIVKFDDFYKTWCSDKI